MNTVMITTEIVSLRSSVPDTALISARDDGGRLITAEFVERVPVSVFADFTADVASAVERVMRAAL